MKLLKEMNIKIKILNENKTDEYKILTCHHEILAFHPNGVA